MKNLSVKTLKKRINKVFEFGNSAQSAQGYASRGETDPTNTTITILTTVSSSLLMVKPHNQL